MMKNTISIVLIVVSVPGLLSCGSTEKQGGFPQILPKEKPGGTLSAALERNYTAYMAPRPEDNELFSQFRYTELKGLDYNNHDGTISRDGRCARSTIWNQLAQVHHSFVGRPTESALLLAIAEVTEPRYSNDNVSIAGHIRCSRCSLAREGIQVFEAGCFSPSICANRRITCSSHKCATVSRYRHSGKGIWVRGDACKTLFPCPPKMSVFDSIG